MADHRGHDRPGQLAGCRVGLDLGQLALQDRGRRPLPEVGFEDGCEAHAAARPQRANPVRRAFRARARHRRAALGTDAVDEDGDRANLEAQQPLDGSADGLADLATGMDEV